MTIGGGHASRSRAESRSVPASGSYEWIMGVAAKGCSDSWTGAGVGRREKVLHGPEFPCAPKIENMARTLQGPTAQDLQQDFLPAGNPCFWTASKGASHKLTCISTSQCTPTSPTFSPVDCASLSSMSSYQVGVAWAGRSMMDMDIVSFLWGPGGFGGGLFLVRQEFRFLRALAVHTQFRAALALGGVAH